MVRNEKEKASMDTGEMPGSEMPPQLWNNRRHRFNARRTQRGECNLTSPTDFRVPNERNVSRCPRVDVAYRDWAQRTMEDRPNGRRAENMEEKDCL